MKLEAHKACLKLIEGRIKSAQETIERAKEASLNETKSSAGDKFETGKAMMQTEIAKAEQQLGTSLRLKSILDQIDINKAYTKVETGALVLTNKAKFYISISAGKLVIDGNNVIAMAANAPLAQMLLNKKEGDIANFNGTNYTLMEID